MLAQSIELSLKEAALTVADVDWLLLHQANQRIMESVAERLHIPSERVISNVAGVAPPSASILASHWA